MDAAEPDANGQRGQASVEWIGLLLLVALLIAALFAAGVRVPGAGLARAIATRIACAAALTDTCREAPDLVAAYGRELAALVRDHAPSIAYEEGMTALPVDFRSCRSSDCGDGPRRGAVARSFAGEPVVAFVHVVDCRPGAAARSERRGADCSQERYGNLYLQ